MGKQAESKSEVPKSYLVCRSFRHEVRFVTDRATKGPGGEVIEFVRVTQCHICKTQIETLYSVPDFRVKKRKYIYPDHYTVKGGYPVFDARGDYVKVRFQ